MTSATSSRTTVLLATAALAGFAGFLVAVAVMHVLRPDYVPARHFISDYAVGRFGEVMTAAFLAFATGCLALGLGLARSGPRSWFGRLGVAPLFVATAGLVVTACYEADLPGAPATHAGDIHSASFLVNVGSLMVSALLLTIGFARDARWRPFAGPALGLFALALAAFVVQFLTMHRGMPYGLTNRAFAVALLAWLAATAARLRRTAADAGNP